MSCSTRPGSISSRCTARLAQAFGRQFTRQQGGGSGRRARCCCEPCSPPGQSPDPCEGAGPLCVGGCLGSSCMLQAALQRLRWQGPRKVKQQFRFCSCRSRNGAILWTGARRRSPPPLPSPRCRPVSVSGLPRRVATVASLAESFALENLLAALDSEDISESVAWAAVLVCLGTVYVFTNQHMAMQGMEMGMRVSRRRARQQPSAPRDCFCHDFARLMAVCPPASGAPLPSRRVAPR